MKYLIDNIVAFDDKNGLLENKKSGTSVVLSTTAIRILSFLLKNQGVVLSRDEFFETVWDAYGQEASNNSLNQYLSVLRKAFRNVGLEHEIIITVPKQGFLIKVNVDYDEEDVSTLSEQNFTYVKPEPEPLDTTTSPDDVEITEETRFLDDSGSNEIPKQNSPVFDKKYYFLNAFLGLIFIFTIIFVFQYWPSTSRVIPTVQLHSIGKVDSCPVFSLYESSEEMTQAKMNIARGMILEHKLPCIPNAIYIFQPDDMFVYNQMGRVMLSRCTARKNDPLHGLAGCKDIYIYEK
ncbi:hypothetical protein HCO69_09165 [Pantoea sp. LS15]|uniref:winged helix-turn-helix domain-containing protein n=1 Tax=Enterobacterales TaxID=91347 RepID=UPI000E0E9A6B|nr:MULTISPECIES: winged helix-turn-helix domain-containing protein [Enterobacterales]NJQ19805.1 hypothetical protein [Pantoea sp. LS15]NKF46401.1 hypothetical protein [Pantoea sp. LS15]RDK15193.1 hypothetical protein CEJ32_09365 [Enterobacter sp. 9-2]